MIPRGILRFRITGLLALTLVVSILLSWYAHHRQWEASAQLRFHGGPKSLLLSPKGAPQLPMPMNEQECRDLALSASVLQTALLNPSLVGNRVLSATDDSMNWIRNRLHVHVNVEDRLLTITLVGRAKYSSDIVFIIDAVATAFIRVAEQNDLSERMYERKSFDSKLTLFELRILSTTREYNEMRDDPFFSSSSRQSVLMGKKANLDELVSSEDEYRKEHERWKADYKSPLRVERVGATSVQLTEWD